MKKLLVLSIMLGLAACIGPLFADTAEGYSNTFAIDNTAGAPPPIPSGYRSPYTGPGSVLLRGQLHAHSYHDGGVPGGNLGEAGLAQVYRDRGYSFVACTNHNWVSGESIGWQGWAPNSCEITKPCGDGHVISVGNSQGTTFANLDSGSMSGRVNNTHARSGLAFIAHPNAICYGLSVSTLSSIISNSGPEGIAIHSVASNAETKWAEVMNRLGRPVWGYVEDDYHPDILSRNNLARTWVAVPGEPGEWWGNIKEKLRSGNYYSYWTNGAEWPGGWTPPRLGMTTESGDGGRPRIIIGLSGMNLNPANRLEIIGRNGSGLAAVQNPSNATYSYQCTGYEGWVRVRVWLRYSFGTLNISSQPVRIYKTGAYAPYSLSAPSGRGMTGTSPELQIRYLLPEEMPKETPASGYVGDLFMVSTADGLVPPGAVLTLSYEGESISPLGGTQYLAIYRYDTPLSAWVKVGGTVDPALATLESAIDTLGIYTISADLPTDTTAPEVFIDNPPFGGVVNMDAEAEATVNDDLGAYRVSFFMNDHMLAEDTNALDGWSVSLPYGDYCTGDWTLKAVAEDLAGNQGTAEIPIYINSPTPRPTVTITTPSAGANISGVSTSTGTCGDDIAVAVVTLYADDTLVGYGELDGSGTAWTADIDTTYLADGARTLRAVVEDYPGNQAEATVSVNLNNGEAPVGSLRGTADGQFVRTAPAVVTAGTTDMGGTFFYIESADRSAGIRVASDVVVPEGTQVSVAGVIGTSNGERQITASDVFVALEPGELPDPLGTVGRSFKVGLDNTGLLVRVWGTITAAPEGAGYFYADDGSSLNDGSGNAGIKVYGTPPAEPVGKYVLVTGISGAELAGSTPIPVIRTRRAADVAEVVGG